MEYRFFNLINENLFNTKWKIRTDLENRTDIYFILPCITNNSNDNFHIEHGLKLRNKKHLELKIRERLYPNGQEIWIKKKIHSHENFNINDLGSILNILKRKYEKLEDLLSSQPIILCYADKIREQKSITWGIIQELTGLHLKFIQLNDKLQIGNDLYFETACIEQSNSKLIEEKFIEKLSQQYGSHNPMGYPEFLFRQYQQLINEQK